MAKVSEIYLGARFGRLVVIGGTFLPEPAPSGKRHRKVEVRCDCGTEKAVDLGQLGKTTLSCSCLRRERSTTHGMHRTPEYGTWRAMIDRCTNPKRMSYDLYGGRGITICDSWLNSFAAFYADMGPRPEGMTIDRIDANGNYEPSNCRWATAAEQQRNLRTAKLTAEQVAEIRQLLQAGGRTHGDIAAEYGVSTSHIGRINSGERWAEVEPATT